jgi:light-regulated signal transduction histidine kinase (bacteriophytochrome)
MNMITAACLINLHLDKDVLSKIKVNKLNFVEADPSLMKHVMTNLIGNAIKYSANVKNQHVEISSYEDNGSVVFSVADNGVGFDMEYADKLFGVFQRLHSDEEFEGTGVGLAIAQKIINRHHGKIWAEGKVNNGATFHFSLPVINIVLDEHILIETDL